MAIVNFVLYNNALSGFVSGVQSGKLKLVEAGGGQVEPTDFLAVVTAGKLFAQEVDAILQTVVSPPANIGSLTASGATVVPATAAVANAAESLPAAMCAIARAAWEGRDLPIDANGVPYSAADYQPVANAVVSLFVEFAANTDNA